MSSPEAAETTPTDSADPTPTRARFIVVAWLCGLASVLYLDRICMSQAVKPIREDLNLSNTEMSYALMAFTLAYGPFAVPAGRWGDRSGARRVLTQIVLAWSLLTALTGVATGLVTLVLVRFLFGAAEAGAFPNAARVMSRWFPVSERGRVQGVMLAFAQIGGVVAPAAAASLIGELGWRAAFFAFGAIGVVWAVGFWFWFRDDPAAHGSVNKAELARIHAEEAPAPADPGPVPWRAILTNRGILVLSLIMVLGAFYTYFFYTWFPAFLQEGRGVSNKEAGWLASLVNGGSAVGMLVGGWLADRITRLADPVRGRRLLGLCSYFVTAACIFLGARCEDALAVTLFFTAAFCTFHFSLPSWWALIIPQSGRHVGTVFGLANGAGVMGALVSQGFVGFFVDWQKSHGLGGREQWDPIFNVYVCVLLAGGLAWCLYRFTPLKEPAQLSEGGAEATKLKELRSQEAEG